MFLKCSVFPQKEFFNICFNFFYEPLMSSVRGDPRVPQEHVLSVLVYHNV